MPRKNRPAFAVIAGTGVAERFDVDSEKKVKTRFGDTPVLVTTGGFYLIARHGKAQGVPPHRIDYRANIAALHALGVTSVIATNAVGSMNPAYRIGSLGLLEQFLDFTRGRPGTFFDDEARHTDVTNPYSESLNRELLVSARGLGLKVRPGLTYACVEGPRYETAAEVRMFRTLGADVVGMTGVPEVVLAREMMMDYASIAMATNWAAGIQGRVSHEEIKEVMGKEGGKAKDLSEVTIKRLTTGVRRS